VTKKKRRRYECSADGCTHRAVKGGVCIRHGAKVKIYLCSSECKDALIMPSVEEYAESTGHIAIPPHDESTAFGSENEKTTTTQTLPDHRASIAAIRRQEGNGVPGEVTILFQEII
jgi:hypothetical protein